MLQLCEVSISTDQANKAGGETGSNPAAMAAAALFAHGWTSLEREKRPVSDGGSGNLVVKT